MKVIGSIGRRRIPTGIAIDATSLVTFACGCQWRMDPPQVCPLHGAGRHKATILPFPRTADSRSPMVLEKTHAARTTFSRAKTLGA